MIKRFIFAAALALAPALIGSAPVQAQDTVKFGHYFAVEDFRGKTAQVFADAIADRTSDIKIELYPNESLVKGREGLQATSQGVVDMYLVYAGYVSGQVPIVNAFSLPFPPPGYDDAAMYELARDPEIVALLDKTFARFGVKYLGAINSTGAVQMFLRDDVASINDVNGKKVRGIGGLADKAMVKLGASVTMLSAAEQFLALQTGTVDGIWTTWSSYVNFGLSEVAPTYVEVTVVRAPYLLLMNQAKYNRLSDAAKTAITEAVAEAAAWSEQHFSVEQAMLKKKVRAAAGKIVKVSDDDRARLRASVQPIYQQFINDNGETAAKLVKRWEELVDGN